MTKRITLELVRGTDTHEGCVALLYTKDGITDQTPWLIGMPPEVINGLVRDIRAAYPGVPLTCIGFVPPREDNR